MPYKINPLTGNLDYSLRNQNVTIDLSSSGDFTAGALKISRVGNIVTAHLTTGLTFSSNTSPASADGVIPSWARPDSLLAITLVNMSGSWAYQGWITTSGQVRFEFRDWAGSLSAQTSVPYFSISYLA